MKTKMPTTHVERKIIYSKELHQLDIRLIDKDALYVLEKLTAAGHIAYLVGGGVRDLLLKRKPKDYDISTSAEPEVIRKLFRNCILIGRRFRLAHVRFGRKIIEVSTFRSGDNDDDALIIRDNQWGSPEEDVLRRDFTINGLFYDAAEETIIDYVHGFEDISKRHLRTIGQPFVRFKQDPVRMLRLIKFQARFDFSVDEHAHTALIESRQEIMKSSSTRVLEEILRMLESGAAKPFFHLLIEYGFLQLILPALASFMESKSGEDIYAFLQILDQTVLEGQVLDRAIPLSCLIYPLFHKRIITLFTGRDKPPHGGELLDEAFSLFDESFDSFFRIPKRIKMSVVTILAWQFRLSPFDKKRPRFRTPDPLALHFFQLRTLLDPSLGKLYKDWEKAAIPPSGESQKTPDSSPKKKKRRRRSGPRGNKDSSAPSSSDE